MAAPGLHKINAFWKNGYDVIIPVHDVIIKILSRDSNYIVDVVMWRKFGNSRISMREVVITSRIWPEKPLLLTGGLGSSSIIWDWHWNLKFYTKRVKNKSQKLLGANSYVCKSYRRKTVRGWRVGRGWLFAPGPLILNRVKEEGVFHLYDQKYRMCCKVNAAILKILKKIKKYNAFKIHNWDFFSRRHSSLF